MKKFYLFCSAGMSTSLLASKMQKVADANKIPVEVKAFPIGTMGDIVEKYNPDCILLGPQVRFQKPQVDALVKGRVPVEVIDMRLYGTMNGSAVLDRTLELIK